jgi:hypothetical protein
MLSSGANIIIWVEMLSSGMKGYHLEIVLSSGTKCYHLGWNVIIWNAMLSSGANVIIWDKMLSCGANVVMLSFGVNVIIWCYHVMLSSGMITPPFFIFPENFTHSFTFCYLKWILNLYRVLYMVPNIIIHFSEKNITASRKTTIELYVFCFN